MKEKYIEVINVNNKISKYRLSKILNRTANEDTGMNSPRVYYTRDGKKKKYFVRTDCLSLIMVKKTHVIKKYFVSIRVCRSNYDEEYYTKLINDIHEKKPSKKIDYTIEGSGNDKHVHFTISISKHELNRLLKSLLSNAHKILKYVNASMTKQYTDFFVKHPDPRYTTPILICELFDAINIKEYLSKQTEIKTLYPKKK